MLLANLPFTKHLYHALSMAIQSPIDPETGTRAIDWVFPHDMTVEKFINDILMVVFFFTVGLEIKREVVCGELCSVKKAMLPVIEAHVDYSKPARYDDELTIYGWLAAAGGVRIKVCCVVKRGEELLASGYTVHACVSTENMRPMRLPSYILDNIVAE